MNRPKEDFHSVLEEPNKMWWLVWLDAENSQWVFRYSDSKIVMENEELNAFKSVTGKSIDYDTVTLFQLITFC